MNKMENKYVTAEWQDSDSGRKFVKLYNNTKWIEYQNENKFAEFDFVKFDNQDVIINSPEKKIYIKITPYNLMIGDKVDEIKNHFGNGYWVMTPNCDYLSVKCSNLQEIQSHKNALVEWQDKEKDRKFIKPVNTITYIEYQNGQRYAEFEFVKCENDDIIIFSLDRNLFIKINCDKLITGHRINEIKYCFGNGYFKSQPNPKSQSPKPSVTAAPIVQKQTPTPTTTTTVKCEEKKQEEVRNLPPKVTTPQQQPQPTEVKPCQSQPNSQCQKTQQCKCDEKKVPSPLFNNDVKSMSKPVQPMQTTQPMQPCQPMQTCQPIHPTQPMYPSHPTQQPMQPNMQQQQQQKMPMNPKYEEKNVNKNTQPLPNNDYNRQYQQQQQQQQQQLYQQQQQQQQEYDRKHLKNKTNMAPPQKPQEELKHTNMHINEEHADKPKTKVQSRGNRR